MRMSRQRGVALVMTLIFLSVITVMAVAFLALTRRGKTSERASFNRTIADQMAETALERTKAEIYARVLSLPPAGDRMGPNLLVSVNGTNPPLATAAYPAPSDPEYDVHLASLWYDPRPPVFVRISPSGAPVTNEFRYYVDLNRNGRFDPSGYVEVRDYNNQPVLDDAGNPTIEYVVGDPQWIGVLQDPSRPHARDNPFVGRYAYLIQPAGLTLDVNRIHNDAKRAALGLGFLRNQGVGPWEINLAALMTDLNTNYYPVPLAYNFNPNVAGGASAGDAFLHARDLLSLRYFGDSANLPSFRSLYPPNPDPTSVYIDMDNIDMYADSAPPVGYDVAIEDDDPDLPWPGAPSPTNHYTLHDFFGVPNPASILAVSNTVTTAGTDLSTYDRYTFYRLLSQLGTDSGVDRERKININYMNRGTNAVASREFLPTDFVSWKGGDFVNAAADEILRDELGFGVNAIPIYTNGSAYYFDGLATRPLYSPRINQIIQIAANVHEATSAASLAGEDFPYFPKVYRPLFGRIDPVNPGDIYIVGYREMEPPEMDQFRTDVQSGNFNNFLYDLRNPIASRPLPATFNGNELIYGIPLIIGAREGFPNFNELIAQSHVHVSRKLEVTKPNYNATTFTSTNQMLIMGISNTFGLETWYPYTNDVAGMGPFYPRDLEMFTFVSTTTMLTNNNPLFPALLQATGTNDYRTIAFNTWGGGDSRAPTRFILPPFQNQIVLPDSVYHNSIAVAPGGPGFEPISDNNRFDANPGVYTNSWGLTMTNRLLYFLFDTTPTAYGNYHLVDAVMMSDLTTRFDISAELNRTGDSVEANYWDITPVDSINEGVNYQLMTSTGDYGPDPAAWRAYGPLNTAAGDTVRAAIGSFRRFMNLPPDPRYPAPTNREPANVTSHQAPFTPSRRVVQTTWWQVNDPLVNYLVEDLLDPVDNSRAQVFASGSDTDLSSAFNLGQVNLRYRPWYGREPVLNAPPSPQSVDPALRDPGLWNPDHYNFPQSKFPNLGWLGRVHRGTPWQTIYMKANRASSSAWIEQVGRGHDLSTHPTKDWQLFDYFTTALTEDMTRGQMSINQTNLASWSALLAGVPVTTLTNDAAGNPMMIGDYAPPAALAQPIREIAASVTATRAGRPDRQFTSLGDILSVPALTQMSPFLNAPYVSDPSVVGRRDYVMSDADYEKLPQQIMSLIKVGEPRFVVYLFGQSLVPSDTIQAGGPAFGIASNYRISGEQMTRAVVRVEFDSLIDTNGIAVAKPDYSRPHVVVEEFNVLPAY